MLGLIERLEGVSLGTKKNREKEKEKEKTKKKRRGKERIHNKEEDNSIEERKFSFFCSFLFPFLSYKIQCVYSTTSLFGTEIRFLSEHQADQSYIRGIEFEFTTIFISHMYNLVFN